MPILAGRVLFGLTSLALFAAVIWWDALGAPWGPATSAALGYGLVGLHVALLIRRITPMDPLFWVPVGLLLFHFGVPVVIDWLGLADVSSYDAWGGGNALFLERGYAVALMATVAFLFGVHLAGVRPLATDPRREATRDQSMGATSVLFMIFSLIMVVAGIAIVGPSNLFGIYQDWWDAKAFVDQRWIDTGMVFAEAGIFALLASDDPKVRWRRWFAYLAMPLVMLVAVQKGDRTGLIALGVGAGWCYTQRIRKLPWLPVLAAGFFALVVMPVIGEWRSQRSVEESKRTSVYELFGSSIFNLGTSVNAIIFTVEFVPKIQPYAWGSTFWNSALQAIPNVGLTKGKEFAQGKFEDNPSIWITWMISPEAAANNFGFGFAMAAEWHYNFGLPGMLLGMTLTGWGLARARNNARSSSLALIWSATLFAGIAIWIRNIVGYPLKVAVWPVIGLWLIHRLLMMLRGRGRSRAALSPPVASEPLRP